MHGNQNTGYDTFSDHNGHVDVHGHGGHGHVGPGNVDIHGHGGRGHHQRQNCFSCQGNGTVW